MIDWRRRLRRIYRNPLILKDGLARMRSWWAPGVVALYLAILGLFACLFFALSLSTAPRAWGLARVGSTAFAALALAQLGLVCLFAPGVAAGAISGERERQTLDVLMVSGVTSLSVVWGKLVASIAFLLLLIASALPLFATVFLFGGIDVQQFVITQVLTVVTAVTAGALSLFWSAAFRRTLISTVTAYAATFAATVGTLVLGAILTQIAYTSSPAARTGTPPDVHPILFFNPGYAMGALLLQPSGAQLHTGRLAQLVLLATGPASQSGPVIEPWQAALTVQLALVAVSFLGAVLLLRGRRGRESPSAG
ncbi:MAG TPA: ABC transporter permease subunit [Candidatus Dormibacteraeota bacterium]